MADLPITNLISLQIAAPINPDTGVPLNNTVGQGGFAVSQLTTAQRLALTALDPVTQEAPFGNGTLVYDTTLAAFYAYQGGAWVQAVVPANVDIPLNVTVAPPAVGCVITALNVNANLITALTNTPVVIDQNGNITGVDEITAESVSIAGINNGNALITTQADGDILLFSLPDSMGAAGSALITTDGNGTLDWNAGFVSFTPNITPIVARQVAVFTNNGDGLHVSGAINTANANNPVILANLTLQAIQNDPRLLSRRASINDLPTVFGIQELEFIDFPNGGYITVNELQFITLNYSSGTGLQTVLVTDDQVSVAPTSINALLELRSTNSFIEDNVDVGASALLLSGRDNTDILNMAKPVSGMIMYDNTEQALIVYTGGDRNTPGGGEWGYPILGNTTLTGTYTNPQIIIGAQGQITHITGGIVPGNQINGGTGITLTGSGPILVNITNTAVTPGTYTNPQITINAQGQITSALTTIGTVTATGSIANSGDIVVWAPGATSSDYIIQDSAINISGNNIASSDGSSAISLQGLVSIDVTGNVTLTSDGASGSGSLIMVGQAGGKINIQVNTDQATSDDFIFTLPNNAPSDGDVLQIDQNGNTVWGAAEGIGNVTVASGQTVNLNAIPVWAATSDSSYVLTESAVGSFYLDSSGTLQVPNGLTAQNNIVSDNSVISGNFLQCGFGGNNPGAIRFENANNTQFFNLTIDGTMTAAYQMRLPNNQPAAGYFLQTDASGNTIWAAGGGGGGGVTSITAGTNITITPNTGVGDVTISATGGGGGGSNYFNANVATTGPLGGTYNNNTLTAGAIYPVLVVTEINHNIIAHYLNGTDGVGATLSYNVTNSQPLIIDGFAIPNNSIILVNSQINQTQNGIYTVTNNGQSGTLLLTRTPGYDNPSALNGLTVFAQLGAFTSFWCASSNITAIGTSNITFTEISPYITVYTESDDLNVPAIYDNGDNGVGAMLTTNNEGLFGLDGLNPPIGSIILLRNQTSSFQNGIYTVLNNGADDSDQLALMRTPGYDTAAALNNLSVFVQNGGTNGITWNQTSNVVNIGTDAIAFTEIASSQINYPLFIDSTILQVSDIVLVKDQADPTQNGIYTVSNVGTFNAGWVLTRSANYNSPSTILGGNVIGITGGNVNVNTTWTQIESIVTVGVSPINFNSGTNVIFNNITSNNSITSNGVIYANGYSQTYVPALYTYYDHLADVFGNTTSNINPYSIIATGRILCTGEIDVTSSKNIKAITDSGNSMEAKAVELFNKIPFKEYHFKDKIKQGAGVIYGVIAEELREVMPHSVHDNKQFIPNIMQQVGIIAINNIDNSFIYNLSFRDKSFILDKTIQVGDRIELITNKDKKEGIISSITNGSISIKLAAQIEGDIFIYGTYGDAPSVSKDNVFELGMVVLQNALKKIEILEAKITQLTK